MTAILNCPQCGVETGHDWFAGRGQWLCNGCGLGRWPDAEPIALGSSPAIVPTIADTAAEIVAIVAAGTEEARVRCESDGLAWIDPLLDAVVGGEP